MNRSKKLFLNTITPFIIQLLVIISGFILPRMRLDAYGSEVNGLIGSISKFLTLVNFLDLGVGSVVKSSLYKPLADNDTVKLGQIIASAQKFFRNLAKILLCYLCVFIVVYPKIVNTNYPYIGFVFLTLSLSISSFALYYFGIVNNLLVTADQRGYIQYILQIITIVLNLIISVVLIKSGALVELVIFASSVVYLIRPIGLSIYVSRNYHFNKNEKYDVEPIKQKWNGIAQHVAAVVLEETDTIVLSIFASLSTVSVYSIYQLIVYNVKTFLLSFMNGFQAIMGELWAKDRIEELSVFFGRVEWLIHTVTVLVFTCTGVLLVPFIGIYTRGITDANYYQPLFAYVLVLANACHCLRLPYNTMILAVGHYKETQSNYIIAAIINIIASVVFVRKIGLVGVAIGTLVAMIYQTIWMMIYNSKRIIRWPIGKFIKQIIADIVVSASTIIITTFIKFSPETYIEWFAYAAVVFLLCGLLSIVTNVIMYKDNLVFLKRKLIK